MRPQGVGLALPLLAADRRGIFRVHHDDRRVLRSRELSSRELSQPLCAGPVAPDDTKDGSRRLTTLARRLADAAQARLKFLLSQSDIFGHFGAY